MIQVTIDGKEYEVPENITVLQAARLAGVTIPTLCDHPELTPYGGCRLCLVEVEGARTLQPSCTLPVSPNMKIKTDNERIKEVRKFVLSLIFSERNHFCPYCQVSGGDCELQNSAYAQGMTHWPLSPNYTNFPVDASHKYIVLDNNRCILCRRCTRACSELVGNHTLGIEERGSNSMLTADFGVPLGESSCVSCGMCVTLCPTGALIDRWSAYKGHEDQAVKTKSVCTACSVGCGIEVLVRDNNVIRVDGDFEHPLNRGVVCEFGKFSPMVEDRERITSPMIRKDGKLVPVSWDEALKAAVDGLLANKASLGALVSSRLPVESLSAAKDLFTEVNAKFITTLEEGAATAALSAYAEENHNAFESKLEKLKAADFVLVFGDEILDDHQVAGFFIKRNLSRGTRMVVITHHDSKLKDRADVILASKAKSADVMAALAKGFENQQKIEEIAKAISASSESLAAAVKLLSAANWPVVVLGSDVSADLVREADHLMKKVNGSLISLKGGANSLAAAQLHLDGPITETAAVFAALGDERPSQRVVQKLEKAQFLVACASYASPVSARANVVFPVKNWAETEGHYLNLDGRLQSAQACVSAREGVLDTLEVIQALAKQFGVKLTGSWKKELTKRQAMVALEI